MHCREVLHIRNYDVGLRFGKILRVEFEFEFLNLLTTTHHNNDSTYEQSYNAKNNTDTCKHNIRVMSMNSNGLKNDI